MRAVRTGFVSMMALGLVCALPAQAVAAEIAGWELNESGGSTLALDSSSAGNQLHGAVGADVVLAESTGTGGLAYRFRGDWWVVNPQRLVLWADDDRLDPGTGPYAVTIRIKTQAPDTNLIQKGQVNMTGGFWKLEVHNGWPTCHFTDQFGRTRAIGLKNHPDPRAKVNNGVYRTLRCERTTTGVRVTLDYGTASPITRFLRGVNGNINNGSELSLGGKRYCDFYTVTCDYFAGAVDWLRIEKG